MTVCTLGRIKIAMRVLVTTPQVGGNVQYSDRGDAKVLHLGLESVRREVRLC